MHCFSVWKHKTRRGYVCVATWTPWLATANRQRWLVNRHKDETIVSNLNSMFVVKQLKTRLIVRYRSFKAICYLYIQMPLNKAWHHALHAPAAVLAIYAGQLSAWFGSKTHPTASLAACIMNAHMQQDKFDWRCVAFVLVAYLVCTATSAHHDSTVLVKLRVACVFIVRRINYFVNLARPVRHKPRAFVDHTTNGQWPFGWF